MIKRTVLLLLATSAAAPLAAQTTINGRQVMVDGVRLDTALAGKANASALAPLAPLASPAFTGAPTAPTATLGTNSTRVATMAAVVAQASATAGLIPVQRIVAPGDGVQLADGAMTSGSAVLTSASAAFTAGDVGKLVRIDRPGAGVTSCAALPLSTLDGTIVSVQSATQATISAAASQTCAGQTVYYGTNARTAINAVLATGASAYLPKASPGAFYMINAGLTLTANGQVFDGDQTAKIVTNGELTGGSIIYATGKSDIAVRHIQMIPGGVVTALQHSQAVQFVNSTRCKIEGVGVSSHRNGLLVQNGTDCEVAGNSIRDALFDPALDGNGIGGRSGNDIWLLDSTTRARVHDNSCKNGAGSCVTVQSVTTGSVIQDVSVNNNKVDGEGQYGIYVYNFEGGTGIFTGTFSGVVVEGNSIRNTTGLVADQTYGFEFGNGIYVQGAEGTIVNGNSVSFSHCGGQTVNDQLAPGGIGAANVGAVTITNNHILNACFTGININDANTLGDPNGWAIISGNTIQNVTGGNACVDAYDRDRLVISGNTCDTALRGVYVHDRSTTNLQNSVTITGNSVKNTTNNGFDISFTGGLMISNNKCFSSATTPYCFYFAQNRFPVISSNSSYQPVTGGINYSASNNGVYPASILNNSVYGKGSTVACYHLLAPVIFDPNNNFSVLCGVDYTGAYGPIRTFAVNAVSQPVAYGRAFSTANTAATTLSALTGGQDGQRFTITVKDANTTIGCAVGGTDGIVCNRGTNFVAVSGDIVTCTYSFADRRSYCTVPKP